MHYLLMSQYKQLNFAIGLNSFGKAIYGNNNELATSFLFAQPVPKTV